MTGDEGRHKDIGLGVFDRIVMDTGVDSLQDVVGAQSESADVDGRIRDQTEEMGRVLDGEGGGFVDPLAELTTETMEKRKKRMKRKEKSNLEKKGVNYLFSVNLAVALRPRFLAMLAISSRIPPVPGSEECTLVFVPPSDTN